MAVIDRKQNDDGSEELSSILHPEARLRVSNMINTNITHRPPAMKASITPRVRRLRIPMPPKRWALKKKWYQQLKDLLTDLEAIPKQAVLDEEHQQRLGINLVGFSAENDEEDYSGFGPRFFTPLRREDLPVSPCEVSLYHPKNPHPSFWPHVPHELQSDYLDGTILANSLATHSRKLTDRRRSGWQETAPGYPYRGPGAVRHCEHLGLEHYFVVPYIYDHFSKRKPHQILIVASDHSPAQDPDSLIRSEVLAMVSFMKWKMRSMEREQSLIYPIMVIGILNRFKLHILQGHFDGRLNIQQSEIYDFQVPDHEEIMKVVMCWMLSTPHGDTTYSMEMPLIESDDNDDGDNTTAKITNHPA